MEQNSLKELSQDSLGLVHSPLGLVVKPIFVSQAVSDSITI